MKKLISITILFIFMIFTLSILRGQTALAKEYTTSIDDYNIYGESLNISINNTYENTLNFKNIKTNKQLSVQTSKQIDLGVLPLLFEQGQYYIYDEEGNILHSNNNIEEEYYTITRQNKNYKISFYTDDNGYLIYQKELSELPVDVYDIIIDPGHGGDDSGAISVDGYTYEKDINLEISKYLYNELIDLGYKVALTREEDENPGCEGVENYCENGRVDKVYQTSAKIVLSLHNNTGGGSGFEIYDSTFSSHALAKLFVSSLEQYFDVSNKETDLTQKGIYNPLYENLDYYFMIRETGGKATQGISENNKNNQSPIGAEGFILELEYMDNYIDLETLLNSDNQILLAQLIANAVDEYINF